MYARHLGILLLAGSMAACGSDRVTGPGNGAAGSFDASISGALTANFNGFAIFASSPAEGFAMVLGATGGNHSIIIAREGDSRPGPGSHSIVDAEGEATGFIAAYLGNDGQTTFISQGGQLDITSSSTTRMQGSVDFTARGMLMTDPSQEVTITVTASFDALCSAGQGVACN